MPKDALPAVMSYLEVEGFLEHDSVVEREELIIAAVQAGMRQNEVLALYQAGRQEVSSGVVPPKTRSSESAASGQLRFLAQRLVLKELSQHPRVRAWRRKHLRGENHLMNADDADRWIISNTEPLVDGAFVTLPTAIYWSIPGDVLERTVPTGSAVASLLDLSGFLKEEAGWEVRDAMKWVLMGQSPPIRMLRVRTRLRRYDLAPTVVLEASVWLSDREIIRNFRAARSLWVARRPAPKQKVIDMANFRLDNLKLRWQDCWMRWNEAHPANQYSEPATMKRRYFGLMRSLRQLRRANPKTQNPKKRTRRQRKERGS